MMNFLAFLFILLSIYTQTFSTVGVGIMGRLVPADLIGAFMIFYYFVILGGKIKLDGLSRSSFLLLISFTPGVIFSKNKTLTIIELMIIFYLILIFLILYNYFKSEDGLERLVKYFAIASLVAAFIGLWNVLSGIFGFPAIPVCNPRAILVGIGTFRNTGQAGSYMGVSLCVLFAAKYSELFNHLKKREQQIISVALLFCLTFLLVTVKRAALIGFVFGLFLWIIMNIGRFHIKLSTFSRIISIALAIILAFFGFLYLFKTNEALQYQFLHKWLQLTPHALEEDSFMVRNYSAAVQAFLDNPLGGSGIGGFDNYYDPTEVHSTYLKMLGETGILGIIGYLIFVSAIFKKLKLRIKGIYGDFIRNMVPFFIGLFLSWGYTFHLRKREFWILLAILAITSKLALYYRGQGFAEKDKTLVLQTGEIK